MANRVVRHGASDNTLPEIAKTLDPKKVKPGAVPTLGNRVIRHYYDDVCGYPDGGPPIEADKTKSLSEMSQRELQIMLRRLRDEREVQYVLRELKRFSGEKDTFDKPLVTDSSTPVDQMYHADSEDLLLHHGIPGQKWGVRRFQKPDGTRTSAGKKRDAEAEAGTRPKSEDHTKSRMDKAKGIDTLSNDELKKLNERMQLESTYKNLTSAQVKTGDNLVSKALKDAAGQAITDVAKNSMIGAAKLLIKEISPSFAETAFKIKDKPAS